MPRLKIKLPKEYVELYKKNPDLEVLAKNCNVSEKTAKSRLEEMGIITPRKKKDKVYRRAFSKEFLEIRKRNTELNNKYFIKKNIEGRKYNPSLLKKVGNYKR